MQRYKKNMDWKTFFKKNLTPLPLSATGTASAKLRLISAIAPLLGRRRHASILRLRRPMSRYAIGVEAQASMAIFTPI